MLLEALGFPFKVRIHEVDESFSTDLKGGEIPEYLARKKAEAFEHDLTEKELVITADTVVWINDHALNKPESNAEAKKMLMELSEADHSVFTGVCLKTQSKTVSFFEETKVRFNSLSEEEIDFYLKNYKPLDKAGAYGIQEFIGLIGIKSIEGDFYNVVGFPVQRFWRELPTIL
jgi:septum formation protein